MSKLCIDKKIFLAPLCFCINLINASLVSSLLRSALELKNNLIALHAVPKASLYHDTVELEILFFLKIFFLGQICFTSYVILSFLIKNKQKDMIISAPIFYIMITGIIVISLFSIADYYSYDFLLILTVFAEAILDDNGVYMWKYPSIEHSVYNPLLLSAAALDNYYKTYEKTGDTKSKESFIKTANWLVNNAKDKEGGKYSVWEFDFTWPWYSELTPPYYSGYAQAVGIVVLARAYDLTNNTMYLDAANKAFQAFLFDYDSGGVTTIEDDNGDLMFIHELGKPGFQKTYILNGQTGALLYIWQFYELTNNPVSKSIFDKGINYLKHNLWKYDTGSWSRYDLNPIGRTENLASMDYQKIHVDHLNRLYNITGEPILKEYADKFNNHIGGKTSNYMEILNKLNKEFAKK